MKFQYIPIQFKLRRSFWAIFTTLIALCTLAAEEITPPPISAPSFRFFDIKPGLRKWGLKADALLGFRFLENNDTAIWARLGAAYASGYYYRLPADGSMYNSLSNPGVPAFADTATVSQKFNLYWGVGIMQGLHFDATKDRDDLRLLASYRGWWDENFIDSQVSTLLALGSIPDRFGNVTNSFQIDLLYDAALTETDTKIMDGIRVDSSIEWAPAGMSRPNYINYIQYNADFRGFLPLYRSTTNEGWNLFSLYLAGHFGIDFIQGLGNDARSGIPLHVSERFGGYSYENGLGGLLRGLGDGYNDGTFKVLGNLELRANLPAMFRSDLLLGLLVFIDAGGYANPPAIAANDPHIAGFIVSSGFGIFADLFDLGYAAVYTTFIINQTNYKGQHWEPISLEFGLHF